LVGLPGDRGELAVQRDDRDRTGTRRTFTGTIAVNVRRVGFDRVDGVLERRVVELHRVRSLAAGLVQAARQVHVDDVVAARTQAEVQGSGVHHDVVADLNG
jgi:hypothetical protein